jgi:hypothetical protein
MQAYDSPAGVRDMAESASRPMRRRKAILVVGMSRSGTSLITHILHTPGATLPNDLIGPDRDNSFGHWEPRAMVDINSRILSPSDLPGTNPARCRCKVRVRKLRALIVTDARNLAMPGRSGRECERAGELFRT